MYDAVTLDQLRALVAVVDEGSFSAAARKLRRVQSAVSASMANLENHLGVTIWNRQTKIPKLTDSGRAVLASARRILAEVDGLRSLTAGFEAGIEPSVSLCFDALFPVEALLDMCTAFARAYPTIDLRIDTQVMSAVATRVKAGHATLGVVSPLGVAPGLERHALGTIRMLPVVAKDHALAKLAVASKKRANSGYVLEDRPFADAVQVVLSERSEVGVVDQAVLSPRTWRVADLPTKHAMLLRGLGWGNLPEHLAQDDIAKGRLVVVQPDSWSRAPNEMPLSAVWRKDAPLGPAHRWILGDLEARLLACPGKLVSTGKRRAPRGRRTP
ncbi:MAG: LysR family transcriptional regulator [Polyangiaceae bacterium]